MTKAAVDKMTELINAVITFQKSYFFHFAPDPLSYPDYLEKVQTPISLSEIEQKLKSGVYTGIQGCIDDFLLVCAIDSKILLAKVACFIPSCLLSLFKMFANSRTYFTDPTYPQSKACESTDAFFRARLQKLYPFTAPFLLNPSKHTPKPQCNTEFGSKPYEYL
jgi:hypothetical protein